MSFNDAPLDPAFEEEAALTECPLNIDVSTPDLSRISLIHLAIVALHTGWV